MSSKLLKKQLSAIAKASDKEEAISKDQKVLRVRKPRKKKPAAQKHLSTEESGYKGTTAGQNLAYYQNSLKPSKAAAELMAKVRPASPSS